MFAWIKFVRHLNWMTTKKTIACVIQKRLTGLAAEMAFHAMLGLFPAIIAVLTAISFFEESVESTLISLAIHFAGIIPIQIWTLLIEFIENIKSVEGRNWFSFSSITAIWIISGVLSAAMNALDQIHDALPEKKRSYLDTKIISISLTILTILLLIIACFLLWVGDFLVQVALLQSWESLLLDIWQIFSLIIIIAIATISLGLVYQFQTRLRRKTDRKFKQIATGISLTVATVSISLVYSGYEMVKNHLIYSDWENNLDTILVNSWRILGFPVALGIIAIAFGLIYRYGSSQRTKTAPIFPGAILAAISWAIVSLTFRFYVSNIGIYSKIYGAVGTAIVLMLWLYLSSLVMLIGEQVNVILGENCLNDASARRSDIDIWRA